MGSELSSIFRHHGGGDDHPGPSGMPSSSQAQLHTIEIPSGEFFPMWRAHMDSHLGNTDFEISAYSVWEFALCDCRLQYVELLKLDGAVEVEFLSFDEEDTFLASPCDTTVEQLTWKVNNLGWIKVPAALEDSAHKIALSNEWWIGLRNTFSSAVRSSVQYRLFSDRLFRLFIVPIACEDYMRVIITTNMPSVLQLLSDPSKHSSVGARFLAHCLLSKPVGEFLATVQDVSDGTQEESETEAFEFLAAEDVEGSSVQVESASAVTRRLTFYRSDSLKADPSGDMLPPNKDTSQVDCSKMTETEGKDDHIVHKSEPHAAGSGVSDEPTAPPLSEIQPCLSTAPSAPPLSDIGKSLFSMLVLHKSRYRLYMVCVCVYNADSPKSKPQYAGSGIDSKPTAPPPSKVEALQQDVHAVPSAPPLTGGRSLLMLSGGTSLVPRPLPNCYIHAE